MNESILIRRIIGTHNIKWKPTKKNPAKTNGKKILWEPKNQQISEKQTIQAVHK